ncbi:unnamed protein product, partial [Amoebophrya sp. A120]|eukprot:GSA120T00013799001.1
MPGLTELPFLSSPPPLQEGSLEDDYQDNTVEIIDYRSGQHGNFLGGGQQYLQDIARRTYGSCGTSPLNHNVNQRTNTGLLHTTLNPENSFPFELHANDPRGQLLAFFSGEEGQTPDQIYPDGTPATMADSRGYCSKEANMLILNTINLHMPSSPNNERRKADSWMRLW